MWVFDNSIKGIYKDAVILSDRKHNIKTEIQLFIISHKQYKLS